jgi:hypothetical protein
MAGPKFGQHFVFGHGYPPWLVGRRGALQISLETLVSRGKRWYTLDQREQKFRMALGAGMGRASPLFTPVDEERT